jgi:hypothetical protein
MAHNPLVTFGTSLALSGLPGVLLNYLIFNQRNADSQSAGLTVAVILSGALFLLTTLVLRALVQGCLVRATVADSEGRRASLGECIGAAAARLLPLIGVSLLLGLAIVVGLLLLVIPGIILAVVYAVLIPVTVEERLGVVEAFGRASELSRGARWKIFGLAVLLVLIVWLFIVAVGLVQVALIGSSNANLSHAFSIPALLVSGVSSTFITCFWSTTQTALYVELRDWKDGPATGRLGEIFE